MQVDHQGRGAGVGHPFGRHVARQALEETRDAGDFLLGAIEILEVAEMRAPGMRTSNTIRPTASSTFSNLRATLRSSSVTRRSVSLIGESGGVFDVLTNASSLTQLENTD